MKKGLAVCYDPHNVYQFLWYYCTYGGGNMEWSALCLPNSFLGDQVSEFCKKLNIFKKIIISKEVFEGWTQKQQFNEFLKMFGYALTCRQEIYAKKFTDKLIGYLEYDQAVVLTDCGYVSGMFIAQSSHKEIVILEDGMGDYIDRKYSNVFKNLSNSYSIKGFILALLGYVNFSSRYPLRTTKKCIKFSSHPNKMKYRSYREIKKLFEIEKTDYDLFMSKLNCIYPELNKYFQNKPDAILLTTPISDYTDRPDDYYLRLERKISEIGFSRIVLKKHPRDRHIYSFNKVEYVEIPQQIPAEVILPYLKNIEILFMDLSSTNLYMQNFAYNPKFFYFDKLNSDIAKIGCADRYNSKEQLISKLSNWNLEKSQIIDI